MSGISISLNRFLLSRITVLKLAISLSLQCQNPIDSGNTSNVYRPPGNLDVMLGTLVQEPSIIGIAVVGISYSTNGRLQYIDMTRVFLIGLILIVGMMIQQLQDPRFLAPPPRANRDLTELMMTLRRTRWSTFMTKALS
jgi:hypothetical protein